MLPYLKNEIDTKSFKNYLFSMDYGWTGSHLLHIPTVHPCNSFHLYFSLWDTTLCIFMYQLLLLAHSCCCNGGKMYLCRSAVFTLVLLLQSLIMGKHKTHYWWLHYSMQYSPDFFKTLKVVFSKHGLQWIEYTFFPKSFQKNWFTLFLYGQRQRCIEF